MGIIEKMRLDGKKGFVTGAARGIGKCTATAFAEAGGFGLRGSEKDSKGNRRKDRAQGHCREDGLYRPKTGGCNG